jgi:type IV pilus assembly protein PilX
MASRPQIIMKNNMKLKNKQSQNGFALFAALMFMIGLTVLAVTVLRSSTLGERIAGNDLDRMRAYQAAEATIRDAQLDIQSLRFDGSVCGGSSCRDETTTANDDAAGLTDLPVGCVNGYCYFSPSTYAAGTFQGPWVKGALGNSEAESARYGVFSGADWNMLSQQIGGGVALSQRPRYWIEVSESPTVKDSGFRYRITVEAWGVNPATVVTLQEIYVPGRVGS